MEWFSSDLGNPRTKSTVSQDRPFQEILETIAEFVSNPLSPLGPPHFGSDEVRYITGFDAVPTTVNPVICRFPLLSKANKPLSSWLGMDLILPITSSAITVYSFGELLSIVYTLIVPFNSETYKRPSGPNFNEVPELMGSNSPKFKDAWLKLMFWPKHRLAANTNTKIRE
jgi:hypothetical protein